MKSGMDHYSFDGMGKGGGGGGAGLEQVFWGLMFFWLATAGARIIFKIKK